MNRRKFHKVMGQFVAGCFLAAGLTLKKPEIRPEVADVTSTLTFSDWCYFYTKDGDTWVQFGDTWVQFYPGQQTWPH